MELMPTTTRDFDKLAETASALHFTDASPLTDCVVKVARAERLNPEETRRLAERTNTTAVLKLFKVAGKQAELDLADPEAVLAQTHPAEPPVEKTAAVGDIPLHLPRTRVSHAQAKLAFAAFEKQAAQQAPKRPLAQVFALTKKAEELRFEKMATELTVRDGLDWLVSEFSKLNHPDFSKFAAEGYTLFGEAARPVLAGLAGAVREELSLTKVAEAIDDATPLLQKLARVQQSLGRLVALETELAETATALDAAWTAAKRGA